MNEELLRQIWQDNFSTVGTFEEFKSDFQNPATRRGIWQDNFSDVGTFEEFESDLGLGQSVQEDVQPEPKEDKGVFYNALGKIPLVGDALQAAYDAAERGYQKGATVEEGINAMFGGLSEDEAASVTEIMKQNLKQVKGDNSITKKFTDEEGWNLGSMAGALAEGMVESLAMMGRGLWDAFTDAKTAAVVGSATAAGAAAGAPVAGIGALVGATSAALGTSSGLLEASQVLYEEIQKELNQKGLPITKQNIKSIFADEDWLANTRKKAAIKGGVVGAFDLLSGVVGGKLGVNVSEIIGKKGLAKATTKDYFKAVGKAAVIDPVFGVAGEYLSSQAIGEPASAKELFLEANPFGPGVITAPISLYKDISKIRDAKDTRTEADKNNTPITQAEDSATKSSLNVGALIDAVTSNDEDLQQKTFSDLAARHTQQEFDEMIRSQGKIEGLEDNILQALSEEFASYKAKEVKFENNGLTPDQKSRATEFRAKEEKLLKQLEAIGALKSQSDESLRARHEETEAMIQAQIEEMRAAIAAIANRAETPIEDSPEWYKNKIDELSTHYSGEEASLAEKEKELLGIGRQLSQDIEEGSAEKIELYQSGRGYFASMDEVLFEEDGDSNPVLARDNLRKVMNALQKSIPATVHARIGKGDIAAGRKLIKRAKDLSLEIEGLHAKLNPGERGRRKNELKELQSRLDALTEIVPIAELEAFVNRNEVTPERLNSIAEKVKNQQRLTKNETAIFTGNTDKINDIIREKFPVEETVKTDEEPVITPKEVIIPAAPVAGSVTTPPVAETPPVVAPITPKVIPPVEQPVKPKASAKPEPVVEKKQEVLQVQAGDVLIKYDKDGNKSEEIRVTKVYQKDKNGYWTDQNGERPNVKTTSVLNKKSTQDASNTFVYYKSLTTGSGAEVGPTSPNMFNTDKSAGKVFYSKQGDIKFQEDVDENVSARTAGFFSDVVKGISEKYRPIKEWLPVLNFTGAQQAFKNVYDRFVGQFDLHIATSIPTFRETQIKVGNAIVEMFSGKDALIYDIAGSEGGFVKAVTEASNGSIKSINLDSNPDMKNAHEKTPVEGSTFVQEAFYQKFEDEHGVHPKHVPANKADVVHESMGFQFISKNREGFVNEIKKNYLKKDGLFVTEEKFSTDPETYKENEAKKNEYKDEYYTKEQQAMKADNVLVGMEKNQANIESYETLLKKKFKHVKQYWDSGNFKGFVASDSQEAVDSFMAKVGSTQSEFTTRNLENNILFQEDDESIEKVTAKTADKSEFVADSNVELQTIVPDPETIAADTNRKLNNLVSRLVDGKVKEKLDIKISDSAKQALGALKTAGLNFLMVGGSVRDALQGISPKDIDIEVYGTSYEGLSKILSGFGKVDLVGKSFGIVKFTDADGNTYDFSVPRRESKKGTGHKGFDVEFDEKMTPKEAAERRDFTWNALAYDPVNEEIYDYFGGMEDLSNKTLRHTSDKFAEDPLRVLRAMQFQSRFGFSIHKSTMDLIKQMVNDGMMKDLPKERVSEEWMKWAVKGKHPELIFDFLRDAGMISEFPEMASLKGTPQEPQWHPEGDVEVHTGHVMKAAVEIANRENLNEDQRTVLLFSALTHDFAKPATTEVRNIDGVDRITSYGHEEAGGPLAEKFLKQIGIRQDIIDKVVPLVKNHLAHVNIAAIDSDKGKKSAVRKLSIKLKDANIQELVRLIEADASGRPPLAKGIPVSAADLNKIASELGVVQEKIKPILLGRHLIAEGLKPGKEFGPVLDAAFEAQQNGDFTNEQEAVKWLKAHLKGESYSVFDPEPYQSEQVDDAAKVTSINPKNILDLIRVGRKLFNLPFQQALANAVITDKLYGRMAKLKNVKKSDIYEFYEYRKSTIEELTGKELQEVNKIRRGAMQSLEDGRAIIYALTDPNVSTPMHELAHVFERYLTDEEKTTILKEAGHDNWTKATSEFFAKGFENYLAEGVSPTPKLQKYFEMFKKWLTEIYKGIKNSAIDIPITVEMDNIYASMLDDKDYIISDDMMQANKKTINKIREDLEFDPLDPGYKSVESQIKEAVDNHISRGTDEDPQYYRETAIAVDAIYGKSLTASQQIAIAYAIVRLKADRSTQEQFLKIEKKKFWKLGSGEMDIKNMIEHIDDQLEMLTRGLHRAGSTIGRALAIRKELIDFSRFSFDGMKNELADILKDLDANINKDDEVYIKDLADKLKVKMDEKQKVVETHRASTTAKKEMAADLRVKQDSKGAAAKKAKRSLKSALASLDDVLNGNIC